MKHKLIAENGVAAGADAATLEPRQLVSDLRPFAQAHTGRSIWELAITLGPLFGIILVMLLAIESGHYLAFALAPLA